METKETYQTSYQLYWANIIKFKTGVHEKMQTQLKKEQKKVKLQRLKPYKMSRS
jgi:hypothetical protein